MHRRFLNFAFIFAACTTTLLFSGCKSSDVGLPCQLGEGVTSPDPSATVINPQSLDCESRLCVFYGSGSQSKPQCSKVCESDSDCPSEVEGQCQGGYRCVIGRNVGPLKCCKMCVCNSFLTQSDTTSTGAATSDPLEASCAGVTAVCPQP